MKSEKKKASKAQMAATARYQKKAYFQFHARFPISMEQEIRSAAGDSVNGFIVNAVREKLERERAKMNEERQCNAGCSQSHN